MQDKFEDLIKSVYRKYKAGLKADNEHPDEESFVCFIENKVTSAEQERIKKHLIGCQACAEIITSILTLNTEGNLEVPQDLVNFAKDLVLSEKKMEGLEILLKAGEALFELLNTNGDVLVGQELMPAPVLRSRKIKDFKDEITVLKDFDNIRVEIKIENKKASIFSVIVLAKEKQTAKVLKDLRITLLKDDLELESYLADSGKVTFEHVILGKYRIEISNIEKRLASIILEVKI